MTQPDPQGPMASVLGDLADLLARQLATTAVELRTGSATAWQLCGTAATLHEINRSVAKLRRDVSRLSTEDVTP